MNLASSTAFQELAQLCEKLESISGKNDMVNLVADFLKRVDEEEVEPAVRMIIGYSLPTWDRRKLDVSYATLINVLLRITGASYERFLKIFNERGDLGASAKDLVENFPKAKQQVLVYSPLTICDVQEAIEAIASITGPGSRTKKERLLEVLFSKSTPLELKYLIKNTGERMRHGFSEGLMMEAIARAFDVDLELVRRANMLIGDIGSIAKVAKIKGENGLRQVSVKIFRPIKPMLAGAVKSVEEALEEHGGRTCFEYKLDGARVQIHKLGDEVRIFSRRLSDVTESLPEVVALIRESVKAHDVIVEGEVVAIGPDGKPHPFQHLMSRFRRIRDVEKKMEEIPVRIYLFDILHANGKSLIDEPFLERRRILADLAGDIPLTKSIITSETREVEPFLEESIEDGHEGLVAKRLDSVYTPGIRGKKWLKIKPALDTLDLAIVAADYGYGYRHAWLSDYYLAARGEETGELEVVGKSFTGLSDEEIEEMTKRLEKLAISRQGRTVIVRPEVVLEVAFAEVQKSPHYKSGYALRFARILRVRNDKSVDEVDTIRRVREIFEQKFKAKSG